MKAEIEKADKSRYEGRVIDFWDRLREIDGKNLQYLGRYSYFWKKHKKMLIDKGLVELQKRGRKTIVVVKVKPKEVKEKVFTYEDYLKLKDDKRYEVINGRLCEMPAPTPWHQRISRNLEFLIWEFVRKRNLGEIYDSPIDVVLSEEVVLQPDIVFISRGNLGIIGEKAIVGVPDLVVEIISPSTTRRDTVVKKGIYEGFGVKEYWIVYPDEKVIEVWVLGKSGKYKLYSVAEDEGKVKSKVLEGLEVDLKAVFE